LHSIDSFGYRESNRAAVKAAALAGVCAAVAAACAARLWPGAAGRDAAWGLGLAWALTSLGAVALLAARPVSPRAFWWTFWGGMGSRLLALAFLALLCLRARSLCAPALLAGYALGVSVLLPLELGLVPLRLSRESRPQRVQR